MPAPPLAPPLLLSALTGAWSRSLLVEADGRRDVTSRVTWLQGGPLYVDLRQPAAPLPTRPVDRLDLDGLLLLAEQAGFAGTLSPRAGAWVWERTVDLQPPSGRVDAGLLRLHGDHLVEHGRDEPYTEHWQRGAGSVVPTAAARLRDTDGRDGVLVRVGSRFGWARGRPDPVPPAASLADLVRGAADLPAARRLLDAEVAVGAVLAGACVLRCSSLPGRAGTRLDLSGWRVVDVVGDPAHLPLERTP